MPDFTALGCDTLNQFFDFCRKLEYGWVDAAGRRRKDPNHSPEYHLQTPIETISRRIAICWDQTELQRAWFITHNYDCFSLLIYYDLDNSCPAHSILVYREGKQYCWFEPMFNQTQVYYCGIHKYGTIAKLISHLRTKFVCNGQESGYLPKNFDIRRLQLYEYNQPTYGINDVEFFKHCQRGRKLLFPA